MKNERIKNLEQSLKLNDDRLRTLVEHRKLLEWLLKQEHERLSESGADFENPFWSPNEERI